MPNRLAGETSPYLLQHKDNPVDWYPWGDEAFEKAKAENKPVFLSVGYSSCHWCHVMAHESFEDPAVAEILNKHFVSVKLDREERPDLDEAYMTAVQVSSGRGGWPMSVFLTPDRKPFFAGTYFPKENRGQYPGFKTILAQLATAWATKRKDLLAAGDEFAKAIYEVLTKSAPATFTKIDGKLLQDGVRSVAAHFDRENGGNQGAPKFPPHSELEFLLNYVMREDTPDDLKEPALAMALLTLEKMCLGGIHDQAGGGFHRYSVDELWVVPHFEKMLSDNALILGNLARGAAIAAQIDERLYRLFYRSLIGVATWAIREMRSPDGLFYSALDADSDGEEGLYYLWTEAELDEALGPRSSAFKSAFNVTAEGNYLDEATRERTGRNILYLTTSDGLDFMEELALLEKERSTKRSKPGLDDKALVAWNGLLITALVETGVGVEYAEAAAARILAAEAEIGALPHQISKGRATGPAFLDDYAYFIRALLALSEFMEDVEAGAVERKGAGPSQRSSAEWRAEASRIAEIMVSRFYDEDAGGFFFTDLAEENLFGRTKPAFDHPLPSPNAIAIRCLARLGDGARAKKSLDAFVGWMERAPGSTMALYSTALELELAGGTERGAAAPVVEVPASATPSAPVEILSEPTPKKPAGGEVEVILSAKEIRADSEGKGQASITLRIPEGFHLNSPEPPARWLTPTRIEIRPLKSEIAYPPAPNDRYEGEISISFSVHLPAGEEGADFELAVSYQACTETECLLAQEKVFTGVLYR